jgi:hypothetical protein
MFDEYKIDSLLADIQKDTVQFNDTKQLAARYRDVIQYLCYSMTEYNTENDDDKIDSIQLMQNYHDTYVENDKKRWRSDNETIIDNDSRPWKKVRMINTMEYGQEFIASLLELVYRYIEVDQKVSKINSQNKLTNIVVLNKYIYERREKYINTLKFNSLGDILSHETLYLKSKGFPMITKIIFNCRCIDISMDYLSNIISLIQSMKTPEFTQNILSISIRKGLVPYVRKLGDLSSSEFYFDCDFRYLAKMINLKEIDIHPSHFSPWLFLFYLPPSVRRIHYYEQSVRLGGQVNDDLVLHLESIGKSATKEDIINNHPNPKVARTLVETVLKYGRNAVEVMNTVNECGITSFDQLVFHRLTFKSAASIGTLINSISTPIKSKANNRLMPYNVKGIIFKDCTFTEKAIGSLNKRYIVNPNGTVVTVSRENAYIK